MFAQMKVYLIISFWLLLVYFLGVRRYSLFFQNLFNGRLIRSGIKTISHSSIKSFFSGTMIAFLIQSPFGAINHIKSYGQSGLVSFKQMGMFISGSKLVSSLALLLLLCVPSIPKKIVIGTLLLSFFIKVFLPKVRFWLVDLLLLSSVMVLAIYELNFASAFVYSNFSHLATPAVVFALGLLLTLVFKSYLFSGFVFFLVLARSVAIDNYYLYIIGAHLALALYFLLSSVRYKGFIKKVFFNKLVATLVASFLVYKFHIQLLVLVEILLGKLVSTTIFNNSLESGGDVFDTFNLWVDMKLSYSPANIIYFSSLNLFFVMLFAFVNSVLTFVANIVFKKVDINKPKQMQNLIFPSNTQFNSPYLYVDHFRQESKKMAAMLENIINIALDEELHKDTEALLRAKKYNLILERVRVETRDYSEKSLKKIRIPYTNQENLHLLQITEVIEKISGQSLNLLNVKGKKLFTKEERAYVSVISNNYDHIFESFMANSPSIYPTKIESIKETTEISTVLDEINISVLELATILKNINKLRKRTSS